MSSGLFRDDREDQKGAGSCFSVETENLQVVGLYMMPRMFPQGSITEAPTNPSPKL